MPKIVGRFGSSAFYQWFYEPNWLKVLIELIKNAFDWKSRTVNIITNESKTQVRVIDYGTGMSQSNRFSFLSAGKEFSNAADDMSGQYGSGSKKIIATFASHVRVVTAPQDDEKMVYVMEFTPDEMFRQYTEGVGIEEVPLAKTPEVWPHEHQYGTDITFTLKDPNDKSVKRDADLARRLGDRLGMVMAGAVYVNSQPLPQKKLAAGSKIVTSTILPALSPALGKVDIELYRPAKKSTEDDLMLTDRAIGEVSFRESFIKGLSDEQLSLVPSVLLMNDVCGVIKAEFLHEYATDSRKEYKAGIANEPRVTDLLRALRRIEFEIAKELGVKIHKPSDKEDFQGKLEVQEFFDLLGKRFGTGRREKEIDTIQGEGEGEDTGGPTPPPHLPYIRLGRREFEIGEAIDATLVVPKGSVEGFNFYLDHARAKPKSEQPGRVQLIAEEEGPGLIVAMNPQTGEQAKAEYDIVHERLLRLTVTSLPVVVGQSVTIRMVNTDRARGEIEWEHREGSGRLDVFPRQHAARFTPDAPIDAKVVAFDTARPDRPFVCDLLVSPKRTAAEDPIIKIRDERFRQQTVSAGKKAVGILNMGKGELHELAIDVTAPDYLTALESGTLSTLLAYATASEFARHFVVDTKELTKNDWPTACVMIQEAAAELFKEILGK